MPANLSSGLRHDLDGALLLQPRPAQGATGDVSPQLVVLGAGRRGGAGRRSHRCRARLVGFVPDAVALARKQWPGMAMNPTSMPDCSRLPMAWVVLLCRSGVRSVAAARRATGLASRPYNIPEGFGAIRTSTASAAILGGWRFRWPALAPELTSGCRSG